MIRLVAQPKPAELTDVRCQELTELFKTTKESVWREKCITETLLLMSHHKCSYCECKLDKESNYMEVEHFRHKHFYPEQVVEWANLLPSCKRCNVHKGEHDTVTKPIIHPVQDIPQQHLRLKEYRLYPRNASPLGRSTIDVVDLNDSQRLVMQRFKIGNEIQEKLEELLENIKDYVSGLKSHTKQKNKVIGTLRNLMLEGTAKYEYSATAATIILTDEQYPDIKLLFQSCGFWTQEFIDLEQELMQHSLA